MKYLLRLLSGIALALTLSACGDKPEQTVEQQAENAMETTKEKLNNAAQTTQEKLKEGANDASDAAQSAKEKMKNKMENMGMDNSDKPHHSEQ